MILGPVNLQNANKWAKMWIWIWVQKINCETGTHSLFFFCDAQQMLNCPTPKLASQIFLAEKNISQITKPFMSGSESFAQIIVNSDVLYTAVVAAESSYLGSYDISSLWY